ncbi:hypothetical protein [Geofilum rhodophaeum]|uniref:hypothetical protein n=1 Tax=Geofilum rhodophaeum TaxID=1965019 RepID=UPI000B52072B|nr:hypothetical protein [Geofilum rhodophaeum]
MKSYILASTYKEDDLYKSTIEWNDEEMGECPIFVSESMLESIDSLKKWLDTFLDKVSKTWLNFHQQEYRGGVNCPNGLLQTGTDVWLCKLDKNICELQAIIELDNEDEFRGKCKASPKQKDDIVEIVINERYKGFHHAIGRYQCPKCQLEKKEEKYSYHYPWEFVPLIDLPLLSTEIRLLKNYTDKILSRFFADDPIICASCAFDLISKIGLKEQKFKILEYDINRKKLKL